MTTTLGILCGSVSDAEADVESPTPPDRFGLFDLFALEDLP
jgi:hypothetical protein